MRAGKKIRRLRQRCMVGREPLHLVERSIFGFDHADVGRELLAIWKLPAILREAVDCHHRPQRALHDPVLSISIHVADLLVHAMEIGHNGEHFVPPLHPEVWDVLELPHDVVGVLMADVDARFDAVEAAMIGDFGKGASNAA